MELKILSITAFVGAHFEEKFFLNPLRGCIYTLNWMLHFPISIGGLQEKTQIGALTLPS